MCGIAGILRVHTPGTTPPPPGQAIPERWLDLLDDAIRHRGPDGAGRFRDRALDADGRTLDVALVHRRLSIIDHAGGAQPMVREGVGAPDAGLVAVVLNGCIYNHRELRAQLQPLGHAFSSDHSDTEALLFGWRAWGEGVFDRLDSMHACALWDHAAARLVVSRDPFGEKPLYLAAHAALGLYAFAGCPKALHDLLHELGDDDDPREARWHPVTIASAIKLGTVAWTQTLGGVGQLAPGCTAEAPAREHDPRPHAPLTRGFRPIRHAHAARWLKEPRVTPEHTEDALDRLLKDSVARRLDADVPVACLLSGGVDSSLVAWHARGRPLTTLCVRMPHARYDESGHALHAARIIGSTHHTIDVAAHPAEDLVRLIDTLGQPFGDSSLLPTYWACKAARDHAKVVLAGDGGDELFRGYERYQAITPLALLQWLGPLLRLIPRGVLKETDPKSAWSKLSRLVQAARGAGYEDLVSIFPREDLAALVGRSLAHHAGTDSRADDPWTWEILDHLPDVLLRKTDHASMLAGVELRAPMLDRALAEFALRLPPRVLTPDRQRKGLLRAVARRYFPDELVDRPKMGFAVPLGSWFRDDFGGMRTLLLDALHAADPFPTAILGFELNRATVRRLIDEHLAGTRDHAQRLYMLLVLAIWCRGMSGRTHPPQSGNA